ncbi:MAG: fluoride efflux transporter CrcB [Phycisphaerae bacterium]|nr:fluoride efflux transporter CrcB [Phycisphaerae bacterium]
MHHMLLVGIGGFLGSIARYLLTHAVMGPAPTTAAAVRFPLGTLLINVLGCFAIGWFAALGEQRQIFTQTTRLFLFTGLLGGFTTFSAFAHDTLVLGQKSALPMMFANIALQLILGLGAAWLGSRVAG